MSPPYITTSRTPLAYLLARAAHPYPHPAPPTAHAWPALSEVHSVHMETHGASQVFVGTLSSPPPPHMQPPLASASSHVLEQLCADTAHLGNAPKPRATHVPPPPSKARSQDMAALHQHRVQLYTERAACANHTQQPHITTDLPRLETSCQHTSTH